MADEHSPSLSSSSSTTSPSSTSLTSPNSTSSSWHGLSSAANRPEAEQALDLANEAFASGRYYKAERLCLRSIHLHDSPQSNELLSRIYDKIPHARPGTASSSFPSTSPAQSFSTASSPPSPPPSPFSAASVSQSASGSSAPSSFSSSSSFPPLSPPSWLIIPSKYRSPLLIIWSLVLLVALLRCLGFITAFDHAFTPHHARTPSTAHSSPSGLRTGSGSASVGVGGGSSVGGWLLGLTNLFPLVLMLLFASGQWQRWLQHQQQQRAQQQH